jgi:hypothetical protein
MNNTSVITESLEYYDKNCEIYKNFDKDFKYIKYENSDNDIEHNLIIFYDKNKKELFRTRYEVLGLFINETQTWIWGWAVSHFTKNTTNIVRKIFNYGAELNPESSFLKTELITSRFRISEYIQLEMHVSIGSYLSKKPLIYKYKVYNNYFLSDDGFIDIAKNSAPDKSNKYSEYYLIILDYDKYKK